MKLLKGLLILTFPLLLLTNEVPASDKYMKSYLKHKDEEKRMDKMRIKKKDPNQLILDDLKLLSAEMHKYYNLEDYPAGSENESKKYTSLRDLLTDFALTNVQTEMGSEEEQEEAKAKLKKIIISAKKFKAGEDNLTITKLANMLRNNEKYDRDQALKAFCIKEADYERVKENLGVTDADIDLYTGKVKTKDKTYELRNLVENCYI